MGNSPFKTCLKDSNYAGLQSTGSNQICQNTVNYRPVQAQAQAQTIVSLASNATLVTPAGHRQARKDVGYDNNMKAHLQPIKDNTLPVFEASSQRYHGRRSGGGNMAGLSISRSRESRITAGKALLNTRLRLMNMGEVQMIDDGNCLFRACSHELFGSQEYYNFVRQQAVVYMQTHPDQYSVYCGSDAEFQKYLYNIAQDRRWGDELVIRAVCDRFAVEIAVVTSNSENCYLHYQPSTTPECCLFLSYIDPIHYNALAPIVQKQVPVGGVPTATAYYL